MAKRYRVRTGARAAPKVQEKALVKKARKLKNHPEYILPKCEGNCRRCPFDKSRKYIDRVHAARDDEKTLNMYANRGDDLARAYAATLTIAHAGKAPYLAALKLPTQDVSYAVRGKAKRNFLIGVQHYDDPTLRLFAVMETARKKKLHIYSDEDGMICTGSTPNPPQSFIESSMKNLTTKLKRHGDAYLCPHLTLKDFRDTTSAAVPHLGIEWLSAAVKIGICERCARNHAEHSLGLLASRIAARDPLDDFEVWVNSMPTCQVPKEECVLSDPPPIPKDLIKQYIDSEIKDHELIHAYQEILRDEFYVDKHVFILDNKCYGANVKTAIRSLSPTKDEARALLVVFKNVPDAIVIDKATPNKIMKAYWDEYGAEMVAAVTRDKGFAAEYYDEHALGRSTPSQYLTEAKNAHRHLEVLNALPDYDTDTLPPIAAFADEITRIFKTRGKSETVRAIDRYKGKDTKIKSVAYAFLLVLGKASSKRWQYAKTETDFAQFLKEYAGKLLKAPPETYHVALQSLLSATGSTKKIPKPK